MTTIFSSAMADVPLVAILRGITPEEIEAVGDVLADTGFRLIEVPLTSPDAFRSIALLTRRLGEAVVIGAGTVRRIDELDRLVDAGGRLMVTPHCDVALIRAAAERRLITLPGVATPTEAFAAIDAGADGLKLFPAEQLAPAAVKAIRTVVGPTVPLCPTGGITPSDLGRYVAAGASGFGLGSELYRPGRSAVDVKSSALAFVAGWHSTRADREVQQP